MLSGKRSQKTFGRTLVFFSARAFGARIFFIFPLILAARAFGARIFPSFPYNFPCGAPAARNFYPLFPIFTYGIPSVPFKKNVPGVAFLASSQNRPDGGWVALKKTFLKKTFFK